MVGSKLGPLVGWSSLHDAAKEDDLDIMVCVVEGKRGLPMRDIDLPTETGLTPLHVAALSGSNLCIAYLLGKGCDTSLVDDHGRLALHWAADSGHVESMMHLIAAGQDINQLDSGHATPLHLAARRGQTKACAYLVSVGASLSIRNARNWTAAEAGTVPIYRATQESLEQSMVMINRVRREHDEIELRHVLTDCGLERFDKLFKMAGYSYHHVFESTRPISMKVLNSQTEDKNDQMNIRDYMLLLEYLQMHQGIKKINPFIEAAKKAKHWDKHPEEWEKFLEEHPDYDAALQDDSVYSRPVFDKEKEFMAFMRDQVLLELKLADKKKLFLDMRKTKEEPSLGLDGRMHFNDEALEYDGIENCKAVDFGWTDCPILDLTQIGNNINDGVYQKWEHFCLDFMLIITNVFIYCRAVKSDSAESYKQAIAVGARGARIFRKHRTSLRKYQAAMNEERRAMREANRHKWIKWATDKRLRGMLPDFFKEVSGEAEAMQHREFLDNYTNRFEKLEDAQEYFGNKNRNMVDVVREGWEEDERTKRYHTQLRWMLDLTSSRDIERHFQHPAEDVRSDMHLPGGDLPGPFTLEAFLREIVWPMDFDTMRENLAQEWDYRYYTKRPKDYVVLEQIQMDWLISQINVISYHQRFHEQVKKVMRVEQRPLKIIPKAPCDVRLAEGHPEVWCAKLLWSQPPPKPGEVVLRYRIRLTTELHQPVEPHRTGSKPGEIREIFVESDEGYAGIHLKNLQSLVATGASWQGGACLIDGLSPKTKYNVLMTAVAQGEEYGPVSGPLLCFTTLAAKPAVPFGLRVLDVNDNASTVQWEPPADNGSYIQDYEVEYKDLKFQRIVRDRVGWHDPSYTTRRICDSKSAKDPLIAEPLVPSLGGLLVPATQIELRVRSRNEAGYSAWSEFISFRTLSAPASPPQALALVGTGYDYLDIAWMPPVASNGPNGNEGFQLHIEILHPRTGEIENRWENLTVERLQEEIFECNFSVRPRTSTRRSTPAGSRGGSRPSTKEGSRPATISDLILPISNVYALDDANDEEVVLDELDLGGSRAKTAKTAADWWVSSSYSGSIWYHAEVPRQVILTASLDYPPVGRDNNLIIVQEMDSMGWGPEKNVLLVPTYADAKTLALRTQNAFQSLIPVEIPRTWSVTIDTSNRLSFQLSCQFRLKMSGSLAYIFGLVIPSDGWITSPALKTSGLSNDKSVLVAPQECRVETFVCDQIPVRTPFVHRATNLPSSCRVRFSLCARNGAGKEYSDALSLGLKSEQALEGYTESLLPPPPVNLRAQAVLSTAIVILWDLPVNNTGDPIENLEISFAKLDGVRVRHVIDAKLEGYQVGGLTPGQTITNISICSINMNGIGPPCDTPIASFSSLSSIPTPCHGFRVSETSRTSIVFEWIGPAYNGGAPIIEWEVAGFSPSGDPVVHKMTGENCVSYTMACEIQNEFLGSWFLDFGVRCRNAAGWSIKSNLVSARTIDGPPRDPDFMNVRMREQKRLQDYAVLMLREAIALGTQALVDAEAAVRQPMRFKKALMEEAENTVAAAENALVSAIDQSERAGIKIIGVSQPKEDIEARLLLQTLRLRRSRRWGGKGRGISV